MSQNQQIVVLTHDQLRQLVESAVQKAIGTVKQETQSDRHSLSAKEAARYLRIRNDSILKALKDGSLRGQLFRGTWRIQKHDLEEWSKSFQ